MSDLSLNLISEQDGSDFQQRHPMLAAAIEPLKIVEATVQRLIEDPEYRRAMEAAAIDEAALAVTGQVVKLVDRWIERALGLL